jgi:uncharacterized membrane protein (DUF2068 family)
MAPAQAVDERTSAAGLRAVATFEAAKGIVVLLLGLGVLGLIHRDVEEVAEGLLIHLHINPERHLAHAFLDVASKTTDARIWAAAGAALTYSSVRFTEAWGLWNRRVWAQWFALMSGALYLPWEILKIVERANWLHIGVFTTNVGILIYMAFIRIRASRAENCSEE